MILIQNIEVKFFFSRSFRNIEKKNNKIYFLKINGRAFPSFRLKKKIRFMCFCPLKRKKKKDVVLIIWFFRVLVFNSKYQKKKH